MASIQRVTPKRTSVELLAEWWDASYGGIVAMRNKMKYVVI